MSDKGASPAPPSGSLQVRLREVVAYEEQRLAGEFRRGVGDHLARPHHRWPT